MKPGRFGAASAGSGSLDGSGAVRRDAGLVQGPNLGMLREARPHASPPSFVAVLNQEPRAPRMHGADSSGGGPRQSASGRRGSTPGASRRRGITSPRVRNRSCVPCGAALSRRAFGAARARLERPLW